MVDGGPGPWVGDAHFACRGAAVGAEWRGLEGSRPGGDNGKDAA